MGKPEMDYGQRGAVQVVADGQVMSVQGMRRGGLAGDPREPVYITGVLPGGEKIKREARLFAWNPRARAWVYVADDATMEIS